MKKITLLLAALAVLSVSAQQAELVVESIDNGGVVPGNTFRVYAQLPSAAHSVHALFATAGDDISIESTAPFYQHPYGGNTSRDLIQAIVELNPEMAFDSYFTIGRSNSTANELWEVNVDYSAFNSSGSMNIEDGAWFVIPTSEQTKAADGNLVLLMQFTTEGEVTGRLNLQGWDGENTPFQALGLTFSTQNVSVLGCTNAQAANYNSAATVDNGSCGNDVVVTNPTPVTASPSKGGTGWSIFPNPVINGQVNIQFSDAILPDSGMNVVVSIYELTGKVVFNKEFGAEQILGGNRLILNTDLAKGSYQVAVSQGQVREAQQIIVE